MAKQIQEAPRPWTYKPHKRQQAMHHAFLVEGYKRGVTLYGRQTGKTLSAFMHAVISAVVNQGQYFVVFSTYNQAEQVVWKQYLHMIPPQMIYKANADSLTIELNYITLKDFKTSKEAEPVDIAHDRDKPRSIIRLLGSDQADRHRGLKANGIVFDEYQNQNPDNFAAVYEPMFNTTGGWALFLGTPMGFNHFYDMVQDAKATDSWYYAEATWRDNPYVVPEAIETARADAERKGHLNAFLQEYELEFRKVDRAVFEEFDRNVHVIKPGDVPLDGQNWVSIDYGFTPDHPMAVNFIRIANDGVWYIYDEIHLTDNVRLDDVIEQIKDRTKNVHLDGVVPDTARVDLVDYMASKGLPMTPMTKKSGQVISGIGLIKEKLHPRLQLIGKPKPMMYVTSNCRETILEFEQYKYKEPKADRVQQAEPLKYNDNHMDGIRYAVLFHKFGKPDTTDIIPRGPALNDFGLPL